MKITKEAINSPEVGAKLRKIGLEQQIMNDPNTGNSKVSRFIWDTVFANYIDRPASRIQALNVMKNELLRN